MPGKVGEPVDDVWVLDDEGDAVEAIRRGNVVGGKGLREVAISSRVKTSRTTANPASPRKRATQAGALASPLVMVIVVGVGV